MNILEYIPIKSGYSSIYLNIYVYIMSLKLVLNTKQASD
jgi:hypothetical protein